MSDPISNFLTRIRNASKAGQTEFTTFSSRMIRDISGILQEHGFISGYKEGTDSRGHAIITIALKYVDGKPAIQGIERTSKPGLRLYFKSRDIPNVLRGMGIGILTTSRGLMTDHDARRQNIGGEYICKVW